MYTSISKKLLNALVLVVVMVLLAGCGGGSTKSVAATQNGAIEGSIRVNYTNGDLLHGEAVVDIAGKTVVVTDGVYSVTGIVPGSYRLTVAAPGYLSKELAVNIPADRSP